MWHAVERSRFCMGVTVSLARASSWQDKPEQMTVALLCCRDRITAFHLFIASPAGVVREVYAGLRTSFTANQLMPGMDYIFSCKACFTDGSFIWSLPSTVRTKA